MKRTSISGRLRINIGTILIAVAFISMTFGIGVEPVMAASRQVVLAHYNADGYATTLVYVNKTEAAVPADYAPAAAVGFPGRFSSVAPQSVARVAFDFPAAGVKRITVDEDLEVYVDIVTPVGGIVRRYPLEPVTAVTFYDLLNGDGWNSGVFIGAEADTVARVVGGSEAFIPAGGAVILPALSSVVKVENRSAFGSQGAAPIYAFAYSNHAVTYTLLAVD